MADQVIEVVIKGVDQLNGPLHEANVQVSGLGDAFDDFDHLLMTVGQTVANLAAVAIQNLISSVSNLASEMISSNAQFEQYTTQFSVLLGSTEAAQERMAELAEFGRTTPFDLPGVVEADRILQGFGLHAEDTAKKFGFSGDEIRRIAGDVAAGTGSSFQEMAMLIGRFASGATGEALMRMAELGIGTREQLTKMGIEFSKSGELLSPLPEAMEAVLQLMQQKYGGMMEAQSKTFEGMMSNLRDWIGQTLRTIGQPIFEVLKDKLDDLLVFLGTPEVQNAINNIAQALGDFVNGVLTAAIPIFNNTVAAVQDFIGWIKQGEDPIRALGDALTETFGETTLGVIGDKIFEFGDWIAQAKTNIETFVGGLKDRFGDEFEKIGESLHRFGLIFTKRLVPAIGDFVNAIAERLFPKLKVEMPDVLSLVEKGLDALPGVIDAVATALGNFADWLSETDQHIDATIAVVQSVIQWFVQAKDSVIGLALSIRDWVIMQLTRLNETWNSVIAKLTEIWTFIDVHVIPVFRALGNIAESIGRLAFTVLAGIWQNVVMPPLRTLWEFIDSKVTPIFKTLSEWVGERSKVAGEGLAKVWNTSIQPALEKVWKFLDENIMPVFRTVADFVRDNLGKALGDFKKNILDPLHLAFRNIDKILDSITKALDEFAQGIDTVGQNLPNWLTPGSPTPFELGLRGISDAMNALSRTHLPDFNGALGLVGAGPGAGGVNQTTNTNNYNMTINSQARTEQAASNFLLMKSIFGGPNA